MTVFTFFHRSNKVGKQNILDLEGLWIYFLFLQIKRKLHVFWFWGWACYSLWIYNVVSTNTTLLEVQLVQFPWNPSRNGQRTSVRGLGSLMTLKLPSWKVFFPMNSQMSAPSSLSGLIISLRKKFLREKAKVCTLWDLCSRRWSLNLKTITAKLWQIWFERSKSWFAENFVVTVSQ